MKSAADPSMPSRSSLLPLFVAVTLAGATPGLGSLVGCRGPAVDDGTAGSATITSGDTPKLADAPRDLQASRDLE
jgi:hypothetical protein